MRNIPALAVLVIIVSAFLFLPAGTAYCQDLEKERKYGFSFGHHFGFVHGQALEIVYPDNTMGELLSELRWDMKPVFYYGSQIEFSRIDLMSDPGVFASVSLKSGFLGDSGFIENRDWMSVENDALTHFSKHTNKTREFFILDAAVGLSLPIESYFYLKPFLNVSWMRFAFTGRDGYGIYARSIGNESIYFPIDDDPILWDFSDIVITYMQKWLVAGAGLSVGTKILYPFSINTSFKISPLTYCAAMDEHITTNTTYLDFTRFGFFLEPSVSMSFTIQPIELSLDFAYRHIGRTRGLSYSKRGSGNYFLSSVEAGAGLSVLDSRFLFRLRI